MCTIAAELEHTLIKPWDMCTVSQSPMQNGLLMLQSILKHCSACDGVVCNHDLHKPWVTLSVPFQLINSMYTTVYGALVMYKCAHAGEHP